MRFWISLLIYILISYNGKAQQWPVSSSIGNFNTISCTFGEIHGTTNRHFHEGIDIFIGQGVNVLALQDGIITNVHLANNLDDSYIDVDYGNGEYATYMHVNTNGVSTNTIVHAGDILTTTRHLTLYGQHFHFEMHISNNSEYDIVNPLNNDYGWHLPCPVDNYNPQINDIFVMPVTNQQNTNIGGSFILQNNTGRLSVFNNSCTKIHLASTLISNGINYSTGVVTNYTNFIN